MTEICDNAPAMHVNAPAEVIREVMNKHHGLRSDSVSLSELVTTEASTAAVTTVTTETKMSETEEERDENGCKWSATTMSPTTTEESSVMSDERLSRVSWACLHHHHQPPYHHSKTN